MTARAVARPDPKSRNAENWNVRNRNAENWNARNQNAENWNARNRNAVAREAPRSNPDAWSTLPPAAATFSKRDAPPSALLPGRTRSRSHHPRQAELGKREQDQLQHLYEAFRRRVTAPTCFVLVGPGWRALLATLFEGLLALGWSGRGIKRLGRQFGALWIELSKATPPMQRLIEEASADSESICEVCGAPGSLRWGAWVTRCDDHVEGMGEAHFISRNLECIAPKPGGKKVVVAAPERWSR